MDRSLLLIGIGNEYRGDDGVGLTVARAFREKDIALITVKEKSGEGATLLESWQGFDKVIIVDAVSSGNEPGKIYKIEADKEPIPAGLFRYSTHRFGVAEAVELARTINKLPSSITIYGIEGQDFKTGISMSIPVSEAAKRVIGQITADIKYIMPVEKRTMTGGNCKFQNKNLNRNIIYQRSSQ